MTTYAQLWSRLATWSQATFGADSERGPEGPLRHLLREVREVARATPEQLPLELADVLILALDAARRAGCAPERTHPGVAWAPAQGYAEVASVTRHILERPKPADASEWHYAALIAAAYDLGAMHGLSHDELTACAFVKTLINERRRWSPPDAQGVSEHVRTEPQPQIPVPLEVQRRTFSNRFGWVPEAAPAEQPDDVIASLEIWGLL